MAANLSNLPLLTKNKSNVTMYHFAACVNEYFNDADETEETQITSAEDPIYEGFKAVLDSKSNDETMVISSFGKIIIVIIIMILCTFITSKICFTIFTISSFPVLALKLSRLYMRVGNQGTQDTVTDIHGSSMLNWEPFFASLDTLLWLYMDV